MKTYELVNSQEGLAKLLKVEMDITKAYALRKFVKSIDDTIKSFNETKDALLEKYGEKKENGQFFLQNDNLKKYYQEIDKIGNIEINIETPEISIDDLAGGKIDTVTLLQLEYLIK